MPDVDAPQGCPQLKLVLTNPFCVNRFVFFLTVGKTETKIESITINIKNMGIVYLAGELSRKMAPHN